MGFSAGPLTRYRRWRPRSRTSTTPASRSTRRCLDTCGWLRPSCSTRSLTARSPAPIASTMSRRRGSAMALNASVVVAARAMSSTSYTDMGMCQDRTTAAVRDALGLRRMRSEALFDAAGSLRDAYAAVDWAATPLGPVHTWGFALRNAVDLLLHSRFPITLFWGPEFVLVYNEAYVELIGQKHPSALGSPARVVFPEAWDTIGPKMQGVLAGGDPFFAIDEPVPLERHGMLEECYFTFSYSAAGYLDDLVEGVIDIATETTQQVLDRRRLELLAALREELGGVDGPEDIARAALAVLATNRDDLPAAELRLAGADTGARDPRLPDAPGVALDGAAVAVQETPAGRVAWLPLGAARAAGADGGLLAVLLSERLAPGGSYFEFLTLIASSLGQALDRVTARAAERAIAEAERSLSETLQRSLLTAPPQTETVRLAVRYQAAARQAQIGGDWYDSFRLPGGELTLVIGDVAGHDRHAAAAMAQVRNLLRGVGATLLGPPAAVLAGLDRAMRDLGVEVFATAVLAQVAGIDGGCRLRWSNAGHPVPVVLDPEGRARLLETPATDALLGIAAGARHDHEVELAAGTSVVFYTDGLVERRGVSMDDRLAWLCDLLEGQHGLDAEALCDRLIDALGGTVEDDVALLVLQVR